MPRDLRKTIGIQEFKGVNNVVRDHELEPGEHRTVENLDITDRSKLVRREGVTQLIAGNFHSLGGDGGTALVVRDDDLCMIEDDFSLTVLRSGMADTRTFYSENNGIVYFTNGLQSGGVDGGVASSWALPTPSGAPGLTAGLGGFPAGTYQVAFTYSLYTGEESASSLAASLTLGAQGGMSVGLPVAPPGVDLVNIYMTHTNGEEFYLVDTVLASTTTYALTGASLGRELTTQFLDPMPAGRLITHHNGRMYVAEDNVVWYQEAFTHGLTRKSSNFFVYPEPVTVLAGLSGVVCVVADKTYILKGDDPLTFKQDDYPYDGIFGTATYVPGSKVQDGLASDSFLMWISSSGIIMVTPEGQVVNTTENRVSFPVGESGAALFRQTEGATQYLATLKEPTDDSDGFGVSDRVTAAVYRNGVLIT